MNCKSSNRWKGIFVILEIVGSFLKSGGGGAEVAPRGGLWLAGCWRKRDAGRGPTVDRGPLVHRGAAEGAHPW
jgi:hypothetical protein